MKIQWRHFNFYCHSAFLCMSCYYVAESLHNKENVTEVTHRRDGLLPAGIKMLNPSEIIR